MGVWVKGGGERERETTGYEPFALHAPIQWAIQEYVTAEQGVIEWCGGETGIVRADARVISTRTRSRACKDVTCLEGRCKAT